MRRTKGKRRRKTKKNKRREIFDKEKNQSLMKKGLKTLHYSY